MSCVKVVKVEVGVLGFPTSLLNNPAYGLRGRKATDLGRGWGGVGWGGVCQMGSTRQLDCMVYTTNLVRGGAGLTGFSQL